MQPRRPVALLLSVSLVAALLGVLTRPAPVAAGDLLGGRFPSEERFVDQSFRDIMSRPADAAGLSFWSGRLKTGTPPAQLIEQLLLSPEFEGTTAPVVRLYRSIFDRQPDLGGLRFWVGRRAQGESLTRLAAQMVAAAEFQELTEADTSAEIVAAVYGRSLGRTPDQQGLQFWIDEIESGRRTLANFIAAVSESPEHRRLREGEVTTTLIFLGMLLRTPDQQGLDYWSDQIESGRSIRSVVTAVMGAPEYLARFPSAPSINVEVVAQGLSVPWDVESLPDGSLLLTERPGRLMVLPPGGDVRQLSADLSDTFISGETGVMGLAVDPDFERNRRVYTCQGNASPRDIRVVSWTLNSGLTSATRAGAIVTGLPIVSGRHGGCQLEFGSDGFLYIGTGDAAVGTNPQNLASLGGKVLRVDALTGQPADNNPFATSANVATRLIYTYGHRNVQGLSPRPGTGEMWSVEHGPARDDEVNRLVAGANAGWNPVPGYNESVPMTDTRLPGALTAAWSTGSPTLALSGGEFFDDPAWGSWNGGLAVAALKNQTLRLLFFSPEGTYLGQKVIVDGEYGRLRAVHQAQDGSVYVTTSRGNDQVIRLVPS